MPLPRFTRLPADEQQRIVDAARAVFAADGVDQATYAEVIRSAGISKSSAYNYFDGRDDVLGIVLDEVADRLRAVLGKWEPATTPEAFWDALANATTRLESHAASHPDDLALIDPAFLVRMQGGFTGWIGDVIDNGIEIGLITVACERDLLVWATAALLRAGDAWMAAKMKAGTAEDYEQQWRLIRGLWGAPTRPSSAAAQ
ncbi:MAG: TetR/AcrR family transcriptional regulator [Nakamurella sp.]